MSTNDPNAVGRANGYAGPLLKNFLSKGAPAPESVKRRPMEKAAKQPGKRAKQKPRP
jgi:hypothetical protein